LFDFPVYSILFFAAGVLIITIVAVVWARRPARGLVPFTLFLTSAALWAICAGFETGAPNLDMRLWLAKLEYIGVVSTGIFWLFFALDFAGYQWWKKPLYFTLFSILPLTILGLAWTNQRHHLIWSNIYVTSSEGMLYSVWEHGSLFLINPIYQYLMYMSGFIILLLYGLKQSRVFRRQTFIILAGTSLPCIYSVLYVLGYSPLPGLDLTPICMLVGAAVYAVTILQYRFMSFLPVAYRTLVHSIPDSIIILDDQNRLIEANLAFERLIEKKSLQLRGQTIAQIWPDLALILKDPKEEKNQELRYFSSPETLTFSVQQVILKSGRNQLFGRLVTIRDISELKKTQQKLEDEIQKRSQYSRSLVHEMRSPLTAIVASADVLSSLVVDPTQKALTQNIQRAAHNLDQRVEELFELARGEVGLIKIDSRVLDLCSLVEEVISECGPVAERKGLVLTGECAPGLIVMGDQSRLRQVLNNLIGNAIKFTEKGQIDIKLTTRDPQQAWIQVTDSGPGIDPEQMAELFDPYHRKPVTGHHLAGLGIGLALSKIIVELHQGKIWAESAPGRGTTLNFTLPLIEP
jgi:PAS domain S-box-containing protein